MSTSEMKLVLYHYWRSSSAWRVRFALHYKGIGYESVFVNLRRSEQLLAEHKRVAPLGVVPVLLVDGRPLTESVAILEFIEETFAAKPLLPTDRWLRARVRQLVEHVNSGIQPLQNLAVLDHLSNDEETRNSWVQHFNRRGLEALESALQSVAREIGPGRYSVGDELTLADIYLVPQVATALRFRLPLEPYPEVRRIYEGCMRLESAVASSPENQPDAPRS
jgi:maleylacetoacetate isomerase